MEQKIGRAIGLVGEDAAYSTGLPSGRRHIPAGESAAFPLNWNRTLSLSLSLSPEFMLYLERTDFPIRRPRKHTNGHHWGRKICPPPPPPFTRILFEETYEDLLAGLEASAFGNWFKIGKRTAKSSLLWMMECIQLRCNLSYKLEADEKGFII